MKKIYFTILTIAALSSAAYADKRGYDLRDSDTCIGKYCNNAKQPFTASTMSVVSPLAVGENARSLTNFERMKKISEENEWGGH